MFHLVINREPAGEEAIERLKNELDNGSEDEQIVKVDIKGKTLYLYTRKYLESEQ